MTELLAALLLAAIPVAPDAIDARTTPPAADATGPLRRFALLVGANDGGAGRVKLRYAVSDAREVGRVLVELGGVDPRDRLVLEEPSRQQLLGAFDGLRSSLAGGRGAAARVEVVVYYSGHADEDGLLLAGERLPYPELRAAIDALPADVRIAVVDSCASGVLTRGKGGKWRPPFVVDASAEVRGHAFLTSSSADEVAQESDKVGGSFFTHYLVSGLRGAADVTRDGRVTLNEAYHFAFNETLARTEKTSSGPQHPGFDIQLAGTGDLVMTDLRATRAGLRVAEEIEGRIFVRSEGGRLAAELRKTPGQPLELGLEPGPYEIVVDRGGARSGARVTVAEGAPTLLTAAALLPLGGLEVAVARGGPALDAGAPGPGVVPRPPAGPISKSVAELETELGGGLTRLGVELEQGRRALLGLPREGTPVAAAGDPARAEAIAESSTTLDGDHVPLALGLFASEVERHDGLQLALFAASTRRDSNGVQAAFGAVSSGGDASGLQLAFGATSTEGRGARVLQWSLGANAIRGPAEALQISLGANSLGGGGTGAMATLGVNHVEGDLKGVQAVIGANLVSGTLRGVQLSELFNHAGEARGAQLGLVNHAGGLTGVQFGLVNLSDGPANGLQLGLVNVSESMNGVSLGLVNVIEDGRHAFSVGTSEALFTGLQGELGGRHFYGVLGLGTTAPELLETRDGTAFSILWLGAGLATTPAEAIGLDLELVGGSPFTSRWSPTNVQWMQARALVAWKTAGPDPFAGLTYSVTAHRTAEPPVFGRGVLVSHWEEPSAPLQLAGWPGLQAGLRF